MALPPAAAAAPAHSEGTRVRAVPVTLARPPVRRRWLAAAAALAVLLPVGYFFGGTVLRIATNKVCSTASPLDLLPHPVCAESKPTTPQHF